MRNPFFVSDGSGISGESNTRGFQRMLITEAILYNTIKENKGVANLGVFIDKAVKHYQEGKLPFRLMNLVDKMLVDETSDKVDYTHEPSDEFTFILERAMEKNLLTFDPETCDLTLTEKGKRHISGMEMTGQFNSIYSWVTKIDPTEFDE